MVVGGILIVVSDDVKSDSFVEAVVREFVDCVILKVEGLRRLVVVVSGLVVDTVDTSGS